MDKLFLDVTEIIGNGNEMRFSFYSPKTIALPPHHHDFYELTIITSGRMKITVNEKKYRLMEGSLLLLRPGDTHERQDEECFSINMAFREKIIENWFTYMGDTVNQASFANSELLLVNNLSKYELSSYTRQMKKIHDLSLTHKSNAEFELRLFLFDCIIKNLLTTGAEPKPTPKWFRDIIEQMQKKENFDLELDHFIKSSSKTHSYVCAMFKKHLGVTPIAYFNDVKLSYALNCICYSDASITTIALDAGFQNLSHFYHLFKKKYNCPPCEMRSESVNSF